MIKLSLRRLTEYILATVLALLFITPLTLTVIRSTWVDSSLSSWLDAHWIGREHLVGVTSPRANVLPNWDSIRHAAFQKETTLHFNESFAGREALIRYTNELWFRLFHDTANLSSQIIIGEHDVLFEKGYVQEYFTTRPDKAALAPWVKDLRRLQDYCRGIGMGFVVVLTPSKASIYPEDTPRRWRRWSDPRPRAGAVVTELFRENGIIFVDAIDLTAREKLKGPPAPLFPKGASHWAQRSAFIAANAVQARFAEQNKATEQIESAGSTITYELEREEHDLALLMNLAQQRQYPVEKIAIKPSNRPKAQQLTMALIGDSFCWSLLRALDESAQYSNIPFFFHYRRYKAQLVDGGPRTLRTPATPLDFSREVFAADCLLLEINELTAVYTEHHLSAFLKDALAHLPDPAAPKPPFKAD
jgi:alginate O-acetyltransferase complex protein AlgJ